MPHPTKKQRLEGHQRNDVMAAGINSVASFDDLADVLPNVLGFLLLEDIMSSRRINKTTMEAVRKTIVPLTEFRVDRVIKYHAMTVMTRAIPNLQQIELRSFGSGYEHKWSDGEDPNEWLAGRTANYTTHDIGIISNFRNLQILDIYGAGLNGRYPVLFSSFPLLQKLSIGGCDYLKWDLELLAGLPMLKELDCWHNYRFTGNINSLRVLKDTLEKVTIKFCARVEGNIVDLADFPHLKELDLLRTAVTGDIRDIGDNDLATLERLVLPKGVNGGSGYVFQRISDGPDVVRAVHLHKKKIPALDRKYWHVRLSKESPDWYVSMNYTSAPPFFIRFVEAGSRVGYQWQSMQGEPCQVNWLDPEPNRESSDYAKYIEELEEINSKVDFYKEFHQPPTEDEYIRLCEEFGDE